MARSEPATRLRSDGTPDIRRIGLEGGMWNDLYHFLIVTSWPRLLGLILVFYLVTNALFACGYFLDEGGVENATPGSYRDAYFFSVQTMATIGYGKMAPSSLYSHVLVTIEAWTGLLVQAMATGLLFAKFSRPTARVLFSKVAIIGKRDGVPSLVFRMANARSNQIVEAQVRVLALRSEVTAEGETIRRLHDLPLTRGTSPMFALTWTAVSPIAPGSVLDGATRESLLEGNVQIIVSMVGIDGTFSQTVHARHTYGVKDLVWDARFADIFVDDGSGERVIDYRRFHDVVSQP